MILTIVEVLMDLFLNSQAVESIYHLEEKSRRSELRIYEKHV